MKNLLLIGMSTVLLSACMNDAPMVTRNASIAASACASVPEMMTPGGMAVRCGPQQELPYSLQ